MQEPLLPKKISEIDEKESDRGSSYQYVRKSNSIIPTASLAGTEVSVQEIRSAAAASDRYYQPSLHLHSALLSSSEPDPLVNKPLFIQVGMQEIMAAKVVDFEKYFRCSKYVSQGAS